LLRVVVCAEERSTGLKTGRYASEPTILMERTRATRADVDGCVEAERKEVEEIEEVEEGAGGAEVRARAIELSRALVDYRKD
jgi:hypothetical protein